MDKQAVLLWTAIHELKLDVPVLRSEIDGDKVTLHLYGGQVVTWQPGAQPAPKTKAGADVSRRPHNPAKVQSKVKTK
jgi:hypothetical protein